MNKTISVCALVVFAGVIAAVCAGTPDLLADSNPFLKDFVGSQFLGILGVILAITLASSAQLHLAFNQIEEKFRAEGLTKTRASVRGDTYALIFLFLIAIVLVVAKAALAVAPWSQSAFNGAALLVLLWNALLLASLTRTVFKIPPIFDPHDDATGSQGGGSGSQSPQGTGSGKRR